MELGEHSEALAVTERLSELSRSPAASGGIGHGQALQREHRRSGRRVRSARASVRPGALAARTGSGAAPAAEMARRPGRTRRRRRRVRRARVRRVGRAGALRARARRRTPPTSGRRVDAERGARRAPGGRRPLGSGNREDALRDGAHRRSASVEGLREARRWLRARSSAARLAPERWRKDWAPAFPGRPRVASRSPDGRPAARSTRTSSTTSSPTMSQRTTRCCTQPPRPQRRLACGPCSYLEGWGPGFDPEVIVYWDVRDELITVVGDVALVRSTNQGDPFATAKRSRRCRPTPTRTSARTADGSTSRRRSPRSPKRTANNQIIGLDQGRPPGLGDA